MLPQIADLQLGVTDNFTMIEIFFTQKNSEKSALSRSISADESDLHILRKGGFGTLQQDLFTITFVCLLELHQHGH